MYTYVQADASDTVRQSLSFVKQQNLGENSFEILACCCAGGTFSKILSFSCLEKRKSEFDERTKVSGDAFARTLAILRNERRVQCVSSIHLQQRE